jgi:hypothetical protein
MRPSHISLIAILLATSSTAVSGDEVQLPPTTPDEAAAEQAVSMELPARGMDMSQVVARFGTPQEKLPAVGDPPISRWVYADYTVYFEHQYVIHAVPKRK